MVQTRCMLFKIPGSTGWMDSLEKVEEKKHKIRPDTILEVKDISQCSYKKSGGYGSRAEKISYEMAKMKYSLAV